MSSVSRDYLHLTSGAMYKLTYSLVWCPLLIKWVFCVRQHTLDRYTIIKRYLREHLKNVAVIYHRLNNYI